MNQKIKRYAKLLLYYSPSFLKKYVYKKAEERKLKEGAERYKRTKISKEEIEHVLNQINFNNDIFLHTSMLNLGRIVGGAKGLTEQLLNHIDLNEHTLLVSALPFYGSFSDYLKDNMVFDIRTAPIAMGAVNERIAKMPNTQRSLHPTHSVVALGKDANEYIANHHLDNTPFGKNSPYYKIIKKRGKILLLGATMDNLTFTHAIADALGDHHPVKDRYLKHIYNVHCINQDGEEIIVKTPVHNPRRALMRRDIMLEDGLKKGYIKQWSIGEGYIREIDAYEFAQNYIKMMKEGIEQHGSCKPLDSNIKLDFN